jgi:hypothetical protein
MGFGTFKRRLTKTDDHSSGLTEGGGDMPKGKAKAAKVEEAVAARGGMSRSDLISDRDRGPVSSLGQGTKEEKAKLREQATLRGRKQQYR